MNFQFTDWSLLLGILLATVGALYMTCAGYKPSKDTSLVINNTITMGRKPSDKDEPEVIQEFCTTMTRGFTLGITGGIVGLLSIWISLLPILVISILILSAAFLLNISVDLSNAQIYASLIGALSLSLLGFEVGLAIGFLMGIMRREVGETAISWKKNAVLFLSSILFIGSYIIYTDLSGQVLRPLLVMGGYGFIVGALFDRPRVTWSQYRNFTISLTVSFIAFLLVIKLLASFALLVQGITEILYATLVFILGLLYGYIFCNRSSNFATSAAEPSKGKIIAWLLGGLVVGLVLPILSEFLLKDVEDLTLPASTIGIMIAIGHGEGKKLINQSSASTNLAQGKPYPKFSLNGFVVGFVYTALIYSLFEYDFMVDGELLSRIAPGIPPELQADLPILIPFLFAILLLVPIALGITVGSVAGFGYGLGYVIPGRVEVLFNNRWMRLGIVLFLTGTIVIAFPTLFAVLH